MKNKKKIKTKRINTSKLNAENELARRLVGNGWNRKEALIEAKKALVDAAEEDGYDGP